MSDGDAVHVPEDVMRRWMQIAAAASSGRLAVAESRYAGSPEPVWCLVVLADAEGGHVVATPIARVLSDTELTTMEAPKALPLEVRELCFEKQRRPLRARRRRS